MVREEPAARYGACRRAHALQLEPSEVRAQDARESIPSPDVPTEDAPPLDDVPVPPLTAPDDTEGG